MRGNWDRFYTSLPLRFTITGFVFYILVNVQGAIQSYQPFNVFAHFTNFIVAHAHLALLGGFTILGMGVIYYILPNALGKPPYSRSLAEWQYWLVTVGFLFFFLSLTIGAFVQGQGWMMSQPEVNVLPQIRIWYQMRALAGGMIYASAWIQLYNVIQTYRVRTSNTMTARTRRDSHSSLGQAEGEVTA
jgi:cbb3-type cytochrome oxidase subunit 1